MWKEMKVEHLNSSRDHLTKKIVSSKKALGNKIKKNFGFCTVSLLKRPSKLCRLRLQRPKVKSLKFNPLIYFIQALTTRLGNLFFCPRVDLLEHLLRFDWQEGKVNYTQYWKLITEFKTLVRFCGEILRFCHNMS